MSWKLFGRRHRHSSESWNIKTMFGPNLNFSTTEAYKLLRTNVMFSFVETGEGHVIGVTSAIQAEGKSSTACNLAYAMAESGSKVLLIGGDLRKPSVASKLGVARVPGLTNVLVGKFAWDEVLQNCDLAPKLDIIAAGDIPPNPSEMLSSERMAALIQQLRKHYEYIVVDLPPVTVVSDAIAISKCLDGVIMVVRGGVSDELMLAEAKRQLDMVNVRILGFVYRDQDAFGKKYSYRYRKKYYKYYHYYHEQDKKK